MENLSESRAITSSLVGGFISFIYRSKPS